MQCDSSAIALPPSARPSGVLGCGKLFTSKGVAFDTETNSFLSQRKSSSIVNQVLCVRCAYLNGLFAV